MKVLFCMGTMLASNMLLAQPSLDSSYASDYYKQRVAFFRMMPDRKREIVFIGNSITEHGEWQELLPHQNVINRGIGGDNTFGVLARLDEVVSSRPEKIFLLIGINDIGRGLPLEGLLNNYKRIVSYIRNKSPQTTIFIQSILPTNDSLLKFDYLKNKNANIKKVNKGIAHLSASEQFTFIDLFTLFADKNGQLKQEMTLDGVYLRSEAYIHWIKFLKQKKYL